MKLSTQRIKIYMKISLVGQLKHWNETKQRAWDWDVSASRRRWSWVCRPHYWSHAKNRIFPSGKAISSPISLSCSSGLPLASSKFSYNTTDSHMGMDNFFFPRISLPEKFKKTKNKQRIMEVWFGMVWVKFAEQNRRSALKIGRGAFVAVTRYLLLW